jgi:hypothetical protein
VVVERMGGGGFWILGRFGGEGGRWEEERLYGGVENGEKRKRK